jgi:sorting nexin-1/2
VQRIQEDRGRVDAVDPPSVIAAREQETFNSPYSNPELAPTNAYNGGGYSNGAGEGFGGEDPFAIPFQQPSIPPFQPPISSPAPDSQTQAQQSSLPGRKGLPSDLIDEDLLAASDPSLSLKKAFVKSAPTPASRPTAGKAVDVKPKTHVFTPGKRSNTPVAKEAAAEPVKPEKKEQNGLKGDKVEKEDKGDKDVTVLANGSRPDSRRPNGDGQTTQDPALGKAAEGPTKGSESVEVEATPKEKEQGALDDGSDVKPDPAQTSQEGAEAVSDPSDPPAVRVTDVADTATSATEAATSSPSISHDLTPTVSRDPTAVPLPASEAVTPVPTRPPSPKAQPTENITGPSPALSATLETPSVDRVAVSPLDAPTNDDLDSGFQALSIGASSMSQPPSPPPKSPEHQTQGWTTPAASASRFAGKGWGAMDDEDDQGLFGKGGPSAKSWAPEENGWGEPGVESLPPSRPTHTRMQSSASARERWTQSLDISTNSPATPKSPRGEILSPSKSSSGTPRQSKMLAKPLFQISISDPTRVGDPVRGYTVYTVRTSTTSPHYRRGDFSVLRRFSDFLWLYETLTMNNPGVIVPPVPDKHPFGRFQDTFIESRRLALERCLTKITGHPVLQLDPDLRLFLESDHFAIESKNRRNEALALQQHEKQQSGVLSSWTAGNKFVEKDEWFESRKSFLDAMESQLKVLSKSIEQSSKQKIDMINALGDFSDSISRLVESDLNSSMCSNLARLGDLINREKELSEELAKKQVVDLLNLSDEYVRFIGSVRGAFTSRIKCYERWQNAEKEAGRLRTTREKLKQQGKLGDRVNQSLMEIGEVSKHWSDWVRVDADLLLLRPRDEGVTLSTSLRQCPNWSRPSLPVSSASGWKSSSGSWRCILKGRYKLRKN